MARSLTRSAAGWPSVVHICRVIIGDSPEHTRDTLSVRIIKNRSPEVAHVASCSCCMLRTSELIAAMIVSRQRDGEQWG